MEPQGRVLSPAIGGTKNPTSSDLNQKKPSMPSPADTGCYILRGDMDHSGAHDIADLTYTVDYLFGGGPPPVCAEEGDVDASGELDISDLTYFVGYLFLGGPAPPIPQGIDYVVWYADVGMDPKYHGYHVLTHEIDSFQHERTPKWGMTVSADGKSLYVCASNAVYLIDVQTQAVLTEYPYQARGGVAVSPDSQLVAILADDLYLYNIENDSLIYQDTSQLGRGTFSADSKALYALADEFGNASFHAYRLDIDSLAIMRKWFPQGLVKWIKPSPDETKWFLYLGCGDFCYYFSVYDVALDSQIYLEYITPGNGYIAVTPDGKYVFYTNPGDINMGPPPPSYFKMFDVEANNVFMTVSVAGIQNCHPNPDIMTAGELVISPDGNWLVVNSGDGWKGPLLYSVPDMELIDCIYSGTTNTQWRYFTVQNSL